MGIAERRDYNHALAETCTKVTAAMNFCARSDLFCGYVTVGKYATRRSEITYIAARRVGPVTLVTISLRSIDAPCGRLG